MKILHLGIGSAMLSFTIVSSTLMPILLKKTSLVCNVCANQFLNSIFQENNFQLDKLILHFPD